MPLWFDEVHEDKMRFGLRCERTLFAAQSPVQRITIVETTAFGRALALDDMWMTSEADEYIYHELIAHAALAVAPRIARVLIIGGGDGGTAREVLRHPEVEHVDLVEIDGMVVAAAQEHLATIGSAWHDPRLAVTIGDGIAYVREAEVAPYDVVIVDGSDPVGPAVGLFDEAFYAGCQRVLAPRGVFVTQSESPLVNKDVHLAMIATIARVFGEAHPFYATVPLYPSGSWSWTWASNGATVDRFAVDAARATRIEAHSKYWTRELQRAAFALPNHVKKSLGR